MGADAIRILLSRERGPVEIERQMLNRLTSVVRLGATTLLALSLSVGLAFSICHFGGSQACSNLIWPAATILETGFEGQLMAAGVTIVFFAILFGLGLWFALGKWGHLRRIGTS